jgi:transcriptional regulator with XRE-family HTH domain
MRDSVERYLSEQGTRFREKRLQANLTQLEVAHLLNISQAIISHIETGRFLPSKDLEEDLLEIYEKRRTNEQTLLL